MRVRQGLTLSLVAALVLSGCGSLGGDEKAPAKKQGGFFDDKLTKYQNAKTLPPLQVPDQLQGQTAEFVSLYPVGQVDEVGSKSEQYAKAPRPMFFYAEVGNEHVYMDRNAGEKFISVGEPAEVVWPKLIQFFDYSGTRLVETNAQMGVLETDWLEMNRDEPGIIDTFLSYLYLTQDKRTVDKLRISLIPVEQNRTEVRVQHTAINKADFDKGNYQLDWADPNTQVSYKNRMMYELLSYLSEAKDEQSAVTYLAQQKRKNYQRALIGQNERGFPVLRVQGGMNSVWQQVEKALQDGKFDVGSSDPELGHFYMTYSTQLKFKKPKMGFFEWLHSDRGPLKLDTGFISEALGITETEKKTIKYSGLSEPIEDVKNPLAYKEGFKVWLGNRVIFVFEDDGGFTGFWDKETGAYKHTGKYQLRLSRTRQGVLVTVFTDEDVLAAPEVAEELLWKLRQFMVEA
ncbi:outer membrane protein assembly factor BamC [Balneatrix alpica]|uniref:Outer membrane protein assembly factor BamC n=1 Tax=Balneatrix alpica TaxID=75684 RepID=A0ABV5Z6R9_9GAMM|nr:outer membrane protein assembly factor BamC [Balneatrix alpica]